MESRAERLTWFVTRGGIVRDANDPNGSADSGIRGGDPQPATPLGLCQGRRMHPAVFLSLFLLGGAADEGLSHIEVLRLAPVDGRAVIRALSGELKVVRIGDLLPGTRVTLRQVLEDRLVLEDVSEETGERRTAWLYRVEKPGKKSRLLLLERKPPPPAPVREPLPAKDPRKPDPPGR